MKVAVIGFGYWGVNVARNFLAQSRFKEVWIADLSQARLDKAKQLFPAAKLSNDPMGLINDPSIDAVAIVTPVDTHYELAKKALNAGKHVFVEKPMTSKLTHAVELHELAKKLNKTLMVDHTFIHTPVVQKMKEILDQGTIGKPWYFDSVRVNLGLFQHDVNVIWDLAVHDIAILSYLIKDKPTHVSAHGVAHTPSGLEDIAYLNLKYEGGFIAHFHVNWLAPTKIRKVILGGSDKMLVWDDLDQFEKLRIYDKGINLDPHKALVQYRVGDMSAPALNQTEALFSLVTNFADAMEGKAPLLCSSEQGVEVVAILEAAQTSLKESGAFIKVSR